MSFCPESRPRRPRDSSPLDLSAAAAEVHRFVARRVRNLDDAADIAQQTLLLACAKRSTCRGENASAWLFTIARHLIVDHYRARNRFRFLEVAALADTEPALRTALDAVLSTCEHREQLSCWIGCISRRLRLEEQVAVLLADVYGHRDKDSAVALGMSVPSFKLLLHGARARLHAVAGGNGAVVRTPSSAAGDDTGHGHGSQKAERGDEGQTRVRPTRCASLTRRLGVSELLALRGSLVKGLGL